MERLTKVDGSGQNDLIRCFDCNPEKAGEHLENCGYCDEGWRRALDKLAAYEDAGMEPEEIRDFVSKWEEAVRIAGLAKQCAEREKNEPLTLDELRQMDGEPVWVDSRLVILESQYCILKIGEEHPKFSGAYLGGVECTWFDCEHYGKWWLAYRRKPECLEEGRLQAARYRCNCPEYEEHPCCNPKDIECKDCFYGKAEENE